MAQIYLGRFYGKLDSLKDLEAQFYRTTIDPTRGPNAPLNPSEKDLIIGIMTELREACSDVGMLKPVERIIEIEKRIRGIPPVCFI